MLDIKFIRENPDIVKKALNDRGLKLDLKEVLDLDKQKRSLLVEVEDLKHKRNVESEEIGRLAREGKDASKAKEGMKTVSQKIKEIDAKVEEIDQNLGILL